jgi:hypothetical protein
VNDQYLPRVGEVIQFTLNTTYSLDGGYTVDRYHYDGASISFHTYFNGERIDYFMPVAEFNKLKPVRVTLNRTEMSALLHAMNGSIKTMMSEILVAEEIASFFSELEGDMYLPPDTLLAWSEIQVEFVEAVEDLLKNGVL